MDRQLGQVTPSGTSAVVLFQPTKNAPYKIHSIMISNHGAGTVKVSLYHDVDGSTYDNTTDLFTEISILTKGHLLYEPLKGISDYRQAGSVGIKTDTADDVTFTAYGEIEGEVI